MNIAWKLAFAQVRTHPARLCLTLLAIMASACVVVWVVSGYDALVGQFGSFASDYLGRYDVIVLAEATGVSDVPRLSPELIESLGRDTDVAEISPVMQTRARITNPNLPPEEQAALGPGMLQDRQAACKATRRQRSRTPGRRRIPARKRPTGRRRTTGRPRFRQRRHAPGHDDGPDARPCRHKGNPASL